MNSTGTPGSGSPQSDASPFAPVDLEAGGTLPRSWARLWESDPGACSLIDGQDPGALLRSDELLSRTASAAARLAADGVEPQHRVLWSCSASLDSIVALLGALRLGAVVVPVNPSVARNELLYVVHDVLPAVSILDRTELGQWVKADDPEATVVFPHELHRPGTDRREVILDAAGPGDDALIVYTSGTTGEPKGAVHTHRSLLAGVRALLIAWEWHPDDRLILSLPLFHVHGLCAGLFGTLAAGSSAVVYERFVPAEVLDAIPQSTMFFGVPTMYHRLAATGRAAELSALRLCVAGSAPLPAALWHEFRTDGVSVLERYGMSETLLTLSNPLVGERRPGSVGLPLPGVEAMVAQADELGIGELMVRGPSLFRGYWGRPEASAATWNEGWFSTGDLASVAGDGYFSIRGRRTELIITGGHNVYPAEVEAVLGRHPSVGEIAVIGLPSEEWGESVTAFVVGADGEPDIAALMALADDELTAYKRPRAFRVVTALPRNAMGKVIRRDLR